MAGFCAKHTKLANPISASLCCVSIARSHNEKGECCEVLRVVCVCATGVFLLYLPLVLCVCVCVKMNNKPNCCFCWCPPPLFLLSPRVVCVGLLLFLTSTAVACGPVGQFRFTKNSSNMVGISQTDQKIIDTRANDTRSLAKWRDCSEWFRKLKCMLGRKEGKRKQQHAGASLATTLTGKMFLYTEGALRKRTKKMLPNRDNTLAAQRKLY